MTTRKAVEMPTEKGNGDNYKDETGYDARAPREDGSGSNTPKAR